MDLRIVKNTDTNVKSDNCSHGEKSADSNGFVNIFQIMDLVAEKQNYLEMLQNNGNWGIEGKKDNGNRSK